MSTEKVEDTRLAELMAVNHRLKTVLSFLKTKHTTKTLDQAIERAESGIGDHSPLFVPIENTMVQGTRHMDSLLQLANALEIKAGIGRNADSVMDECVFLLEKKVALLKEINTLPK